MFRVRYLLLSVLALTTILAQFGVSQAVVPFTIRVQTATTVTDIPPGGTVPIEAGAIGLTARATFTFTNAGQDSVSITGIDLTGSADFSARRPEPGFPLRPRQSFTVDLQYLPRSGSEVNGAIRISFLQGSRALSFAVNLLGRSPEFALSYTPQGGNATQVPPGGTIVLPETDLEATSTAAVVLTNRGTAAGIVNGVSVSGPGYEAAGVPLLPAEVKPESTLAFTVEFTPEQLGTLIGNLAIEFVNRTETFTLEGPAVGAQYAYEFIRDSEVRPVEPDQIVPLPDTLVNATTSIVVRVRNAGNDDGEIAAISASGTGYSVTDLPILPVKLAPGGSALFTLNFTPSQAGQLAGRLTIGNDRFDLVGKGVGSLLKFSVTIGGTMISIEDQGTITFPPSAVGGSSSATLAMTNSGTSDAVVTSIALGQSSKVFSLSGLPSLPLTLAPNASAAFTIEFTPLVEGAATNTVLVDTVSFTLSGTGTAPTKLPGYRFEGASGSQDPRSQPAIGLTLDSPYPLPLKGTLLLDYASAGFSDDPAVQFSTGGRTVEFRIPADSVQAIFANQSNQVRVQAGTVAGTITITPTFATEGGADLTPDPATPVTMTVAESAPVVLSVSISARTATSLTLQVTGFSTTRSVREMDLQFTPVAGRTISTTSLKVNVDASFTAWYQNGQSVQFGSQFTATVPLTFSGEPPEGSTLVGTIQSVAVTLSNSRGTSAPVSVTVP